MLKGHVFKEQIFGNQVFAYFIDTFLNGKCGIGDYGNKMEVSYNGSNVTIQDGLACIRGRFIEEDSSTTLEAGIDSAFCSLVIEIDLDKENTEEQLNQASYKIVKSTSNYPSLTQTDIVKNNAGIYQHELARFKTSTSGIIDFVDKRTYLDFDSIYSMMQKDYEAVLEQLKAELANVKDGSAYLLKSNIVTLYNNKEGTTETINLSESVKNYNYLEIFYKLHSDTGAQYDLYGSVKISATDKYFSASFIRPTTSGILQIVGKRYLIEEDVISPAPEPEFSVGISANYVSQFEKDSKILRICKVVGYK